jgi:hypothetical protein
LNPTQVATFNRLKVIVERPFLLSAGSFSSAEVLAGLAERQTLLTWMQGVTQGLAAVPATAAGFEELEQNVKRGQTDLEKLWPREQQAFLRALADRQAALARDHPDFAVARGRMRVSAAPEGSRNPVVAAAYTQDGFEFLDTRLLVASGDAANSSLDVLPGEEVNQWLMDENWKCLETRAVRWSEDRGTAGGRLFGTKRFVIECRGEGCAGIRYRLRTRGSLRHYGLSKPTPLLEMQGSFWSYQELDWEFMRPAHSTGSPDMRIHTWTNSWGDNGPGCRFF